LAGNLHQYRVGYGLKRVLLCRKSKKVLFMTEAKQPGKAAQTRRMTVCSKGFERLSGQRWVFFPIISLSGKWLLDSGFKIGHVVDITCEEGKLTITLSKEQRYADQ
jgi:hypothetical protein